MKMKSEIEKKDIKGYECKHGVYVTANDYSNDDAVILKTYIHSKNGEKTPKIKIIENFKRPFWITKTNFRNHEEKKEWEDINKLQKFETTQINLYKSICRSLGRAPDNGNIRTLLRSPYVYGCDVSTPTIIKQKYMETFPECISENSIAVADIETDIETKQILMASITMKNKVKIIVLKSFFKGLYDPKIEIQKKFNKYLHNYVVTRNITLDIELVDRSSKICTILFSTAHLWKPDILTFWNMDFDIPLICECLKNDGYDLADIFSDPEVPKKYRHFNYKKGEERKVTASGNEMILAPQERWHWVNTPASFIILDAMCVYYRIRLAEGKLPSYKLDSILEENLGIRKLNFKEADHITNKKEWHMFMQKNYPVEYCIYNIFDCISIELLDEKTTDLKLMISVLCGFSEYSLFKSQPKRTCDDLYFLCLKKGKVIGTTSNQMKTEKDENTVSLKKWIVTLPSHLVEDNGLKCLEELPDVRTGIRLFCADQDIEGTYPTIQEAWNVSKETTVLEVLNIEGLTDPMRRMVGINLMSPQANAIEIASSVFKLPSFDPLLESFCRELKNKNILTSLPNELKDVVDLNKETKFNSNPGVAYLSPSIFQQYDDELDSEDEDEET